MPWFKAAGPKQLTHTPCVPITLIKTSGWLLPSCIVCGLVVTLTSGMLIGAGLKAIMVSISLQVWLGLVYSALVLVRAVARVLVEVLVLVVFF
jgi:hypothetical protein